MTSAESIVALSRLTHRFGMFTALDTVSFDVPEKQIFALLGPNGCGKTTLFRILTTLLTPTQGHARIAGADVVLDRERVLRTIGVVFQKPSLDGKLTALENLIHQGQLYGLSGHSLKRRSLQLLERFGAANRAQVRVETLSGGQQRRIELAKGLLHGPRLLILDEPSSGLDPSARSSLMNHLAELRDREGVTSMLTSHIMEEADRCDQVAVMDRGRLAALGQPGTLKNTIGGDIVTVHAHGPDTLSARIAERFKTRANVVDGAIQVEWERGHEFIPPLMEAFGADIDGVSVSKPTLEDVFIRLTGHRFEITSDEAGKGSTVPVPAGPTESHKKG